MQDTQYYIDLYDRHTVERCRWNEQWFSKEDLGDGSGKGEKAKALLDVKNRWKKIVGEIKLYFLCGERYVNKAETIQEWINRDKEKDEAFEQAQPPQGISCLKCNSKMAPIDKDLYWGNDERVLFMFECSKCGKRRAFFDNGEEFDTRSKCSKCGNIVQTTDFRKKNKITTKYNCLHCGFTETKVLDLDKKPKEIKEIIDKDFDVDRKRFCLSEEEGKKYKDDMINFNNLSRLVDEWEQKDKQKDLYDAVAKVKKLNIADLEKILVTSLEKENFKKLELSKPDIGRIVVIGFTVQDASTGVHEHTRRMALKKTINKALMETNWKLVEDSISYKLGFLSGRIRGFELEEDLVKMVEARQGKN